MRDSERKSAVATLISRGRRETNQTVDAAGCEVINDRGPRENAPLIRGISREQGSRQEDARRSSEALTVKGPSWTRTLRRKYVGLKEWW
jgi:hypothetical protein